jgi:hypothetical protein
MKDIEITRLRKKLKDPNYEPPKFNHKKLSNRGDFSLPSITDTHSVSTGNESFIEPSKADRLNEFAQKYKTGQDPKSVKANTIDHSTMTNKVETRAFTI